jgi:hypothetical protein
VKKAGVFRIAGGWQRVIRAVFKGRRKLKRSFPFRSWLFIKPRVRVEGRRRPDNWVESSRTRGALYRLVDLTVLQIDIPPVIYATPPQARAIIKSTTYSEDLQAVTDIL